MFDYRSASNTTVTLKDAIAMLNTIEFGEIVLSSVDNDGKMTGIDLSVLSLIEDITRPVILSGGAASEIDFMSGFKAQQLSGIGVHFLPIQGILH